MLRRSMMLFTVFLFGFLGTCSGINLKVLSSARVEMAKARECVHTILQCTSVYTPVTTDQLNGILFENMWELDVVCSLNVGFLECVEAAQKFCVDRNIEPVEVVMIKNRLWARDLCAKNSDWKKRYIEHAPCLNREFPVATGHCNLQLPIPSVKAGMMGMCRYLDGLMDCKAKFLERRCGETAADLYIRIALLNGGREYLCSKHQTMMDEDSPKLLAAQILNNIRTFMQNMSKIFRDASTHEKVAGILQMMNPTDPDFQYPFEIETEEFFKKLKESTPKDVVGMQKDEEEEFVKPLADIDDLLAEEDVDDFPQRQNILEDRLETQRTPEAYTVSIDPVAKMEDIETEKEEFDLNEIPLASDGVRDSSDDQLSCSKFYSVLQAPSFESNASFNMYEILNRGEKNHLGSGETMVEWETFKWVPLDDLFCSWLDPDSSRRLFRCAIKLTELKSSQPEKKSRTHPVAILSLYTSEAVNHSDEISLSEIATICVENYQPSEDVSMEMEEASYSPKSTLREYMHHQNIHRSGEEWNEADSMPVLEDEFKQDSPLHRTYSLNDNPESYYEGSIEETVKEMDKDESETEGGVSLNTNVSNVPLEDYQIPELGNVAKGKQGSIYRIKYLKRPHSIDKHHIAYYPISDEVSVEESSEFEQNEHQFCQGDSTMECPRTDSIVDVDPVHKSANDFSQHCKPDIQRILGTRIRPGVYIDARDIETIDPFKGLDVRYFDKSSFAENINYIVVGNPYIPEDSTSDAEDGVYFVTPSTETVPVDITRSEAAQIIDEIENIIAKQVEEKN